MSVPYFDVLIIRYRYFNVYVPRPVSFDDVIGSVWRDSTSTASNGSAASPIGNHYKLGTGQRVWVFRSDRKNRTSILHRELDIITRYLHRSTGKQATFSHPSPTNGPIDKLIISNLYHLTRPQCRVTRGLICRTSSWGCWYSP